MGGAFFQTEDNETFEEALDYINLHFEAFEDGMDVSADAALALVENLERMGLYELAVSVIEKVPAGERTEEVGARAGAVRGKAERKEAILRSNFEKNIAALEESFPSLRAMMEERGDREVLVGGDFETGYRIIEMDGDECADITFLKDEVEEFRIGLKARLEEARAQKTIVFSNFLFADALLWFAAETERKRRESELMIYVVEPDADVFRAVLKTHDLSELLRRKRIVPFVGGDFAGRMREWFGGNIFARLPKIFILAGDVWDEVMSCMDKANTNHREEIMRMLNGIHKYYNGISGEEWRAKFGGGCLKILIPTIRFSTFVRYCARDAARAFERLGHTVEIHIAPEDVYYEDDFTLLNHISEFRPDLVFEIDYCREEHCFSMDSGGGSVRIKLYPDPLPVVSWDQDSEGTLFGGPRNVAPLDFIFTVFKCDYEKAGFTPGDVHVLPIVASEEVFYPMELTDADIAEYGCDVSYVGNVPSWRELAGPEASPLNRELYARVRERLEADLNSIVSMEEHEEAVRAAAGEMGMNADGDFIGNCARAARSSGVVRLLTRSLPMEWAAEAGFDLRLYGSGWDENPSLSSFARGPIENGPPLCRACRASAINISTSTALSMHQRVVECMLSGGFVLARHMPPGKDKLSIYDHFEAGEEFDVFRDKKDLIEKIKYYLKNEDRRKEMAARGMRKALEKYTYYRQMEFVLDVVRNRFRLSGGAPDC